MSSEKEEEKDNNNDNTKKRSLSSTMTTTASGEAEGVITPITAEGEMPQKRFYRTRAHCNPLSHNDTFEYPTHPKDMDWSVDHFLENKQPTVLDIGCGFGGLTVKLSTLLPEERILGMEIRAKVTEYVRLRLVALRKESKKKNETSTAYQNASVMRTNSMKYLAQYCYPQSLSKVFFLFSRSSF